ncbi:hypothetical protein CLRAG_05520 [Clostridium ragsdalei P11]|uniref:Uncharacterized protein n=1 Tax=Clostridium ragsdalei P11 TaxID=1353534 RepID=A0A1A6B2B4_9CLOT|nr:hypothetical protein [Clostridium ragsdalei]OBR96423.1 hypothetical protein CLRAG_05520 [Clostridium ragsdalei P11]
MIRKKFMYSLALSTIMILGAGNCALAESIDQLPNIQDNSLVLGKSLFKLDSANNSVYNLNTFVESSKTVDNKNGVYYKYNGKWYTGKDIESFTNLKNGTPLDTISNDILKVNGEDSSIYKNHNFSFDWYQDGDYSHDKDADNESIEQFVVNFNQNINGSKGTLKIIVPDNTKKDPYGTDKLGEIIINLDGSNKPTALANVHGGKPVSGFVVKNKGNVNSLYIELTEDWTRILNTEETGINYYDARVNGLKLTAENLEDANGNKLTNADGSTELTAKRSINLAKDTQKPKVIYQKPIYTYIGENGFQTAGNTRLVFNEPVQIFTQEMADSLEKSGGTLPEIESGYNPLTPSQQQLKDNKYGLPIFSAKYYKVDDKGNNILDKDGNPVTIEGKYSLMGDILKTGAKGEDNGDKIAFRLNQIPFKYDFDPQNEGIIRFRDFGSFLINPVTTLTEGKWKLVAKNITDDAGNTMDDYVSDPIEIKPYFTIEKLTKEGIKVHFTDPFAKNTVFGNKVIVLVYKGDDFVGMAYLNDLKEGQTEAEGTFTKPLTTLEGTYNINNIIYTVPKDNSSLNTQDTTSNNNLNTNTTNNTDNKDNSSADNLSKANNEDTLKNTKDLSNDTKLNQN